MANPRGSQNISLNSFSKKNKRKTKQNLIIFNIIVSTLLVLCIIATTAMYAIAYMTEDMQYVHIDKTPENLGIDSSAVAHLPTGIINIALFGVDSRSKVTDDKSKPIAGLSDTIMILSVNTEEKTVKITSILRDTWIMANHKNGYYMKITEIYNRYGVQTQLKTINQHFGMNITDYVSVNLHQLWKVIDLMGGVDLHITETERQKINGLNNSEGFGIEPVKESGLVHLTGGQAMSYARIRDDSEQYRALRQQKIMSCLFEKAKNMPKTEYPKLLKEILSHVETSLSFSEIIEFTPLLSESSIHIQTTSIPGNEVVAEGGIFEDTRGGWVWKYDLTEAKKYLHKWIYGIE